MTVWELASLVSRLLAYLAVIAVPGTALVIWLAWRTIPALAVPIRQHLLLVQLVFVLLGFLAVSLYFLLQIGAINQQGLAGMLDYQLGVIMAETALGDGTRYRLAGLALAALPAGLLLLPGMASQPRVQLAALLLWLMASVLLASSFAVFGHVVNLPWTGKLAAIIHLVTIGMWAGSLYALHRVCRHDSDTDVQLLMMHYGDIARFMIAGLLVSGGVLLWQLTGSMQALFGSAYGLSLLAKLTLVVLMMGLGALNRFRLVPQLLATGGRARLQRSIRLEIGLAFCILGLTASLTTLTGPM